MSTNMMVPRRLFVAVTALLVAAIADSAGATAPTRPDIVIFIADDHGHLDSSLAGDAAFQTPNLERIARAGMSFTHAFATSPTCAPSRAALLTGLMPARNGAMLNHQPPRQDAKKLPAYFHKLGYEVIAFGKVAHYDQAKDYGFDLASHDGFHQDECVAAAVDYLNRRASDRPLSLLVGTNWPHVPWPKISDDVGAAAFRLPPTHVDTRETRIWRARYAEAVQRFDRDLGEVYDAAYARLGENTLFLHFSDHGAQWPFGKWNLYDAGIRVPFLAVWPGKIASGRRSDAMINLVDVLPTLIEVAGGNPPPAIDGQSFAQVLTGRKAAHRERVFTTHSGDGRMNRYPMRSVRTERWKYIRNLRPGEEFTTHINKAKAVDGRSYWRTWVERARADPAAAAIVARYRRRPAEELYDVRNDPFEQHNLADMPQHAEILAQLRADMDAWMREQGDAGIVTEDSNASAYLQGQPTSRRHYKKGDREKH